jgi:hypothetical protein
MANVQEHATPLAGAGIERGVEVHITGDVDNRAASGGCCASPCSVLLLLGFDEPFGSILAAKLLGTGVVILVLRENTKHRINLV